MTTAIVAAESRSPFVGGGAERGAEVRELEADPGERLELARPDHNGDHLGRDTRVVLGVSRRGPSAMSSVAASCSSANWRIVSSIEYRVRPDDAIGNHERLADERFEQVEHRVLVVAPGTADRRRGGKVEPAREHRTPAQQRALVVVEQVVRPLHRVAQRLVTFQTHVATRTATGSGRRVGPAARVRSSRSSAPRPARSRAGSRRAGDRSRPPHRPRRPCRG